MIPIILILVIVVMIDLIIDKPYGLVDGILSAICEALIGGVIVCFYLVVQGSLNEVEPVGQVASETLVNIADTSYPNTHGHVSGGIFYIYGSISTDNEQAFNYYVKQDDGSFKLKSAPASDSTIIYTDGAPKVESTSYVCERGKVIFEPWSVASCDERPTTYKFYIPEGSIAEGYRLGE